MSWTPKQMKELQEPSTCPPGADLLKEHLKRAEAWPGGDSKLCSAWIRYSIRALTSFTAPAFLKCQEIMQRASLSVIMWGRRHEVIVLKPKVKPGCPKKSQPDLELHFVVLQEEKLILGNFFWGGFAKVKGILWSHQHTTTIWAKLGLQKYQMSVDFMSCPAKVSCFLASSFWESWHLEFLSEQFSGHQH